MTINKKEVAEFRQELRDLADRELAIYSRRRQMFDILVAKCGDDKMARRFARIVFHELMAESLRQLRDDRLEFMYEEGEDDEGQKPFEA